MSDDLGWSDILACSPLIDCDDIRKRLGNDELNVSLPLVSAQKWTNPALETSQIVSVITKIWFTSAIPSHPPHFLPDLCCFIPFLPSFDHFAILILLSHFPHSFSHFHPLFSRLEKVRERGNRRVQRRWNRSSIESEIGEDTLKSYWRSDDEGLDSYRRGDSLALRTLFPLRCANLKHSDWRTKALTKTLG